MNKFNFIPKEQWIYHEKQESKLCGQHCLNNLLQGLYFTAPDLADIAFSLDERERKLLNESHLNTRSNNVDEFGNFSIEVLRAALDRMCGMNLIHSDSNNTVDTERGFVVNRHEHWLTILKVGEHWWDLNSCIERPLCISSFQLDAYLAQLKIDGYSVFVAKGKFPEPDQDLPHDGPNWYPVSELLGGVKQPEQPKFKAFSGAGNRLDGKQPVNNINLSEISHLSEDEMLARAIALSIEEPKIILSENEKKDKIRTDRLAALERRGLK